MRLNEIVKGQVYANEATFISQNGAYISKFDGTELFFLSRFNYPSIGDIRGQIQKSLFEGIDVGSVDGFTFGFSRLDNAILALPDDTVDSLLKGDSDLWEFVELSRQDFVIGEVAQEALLVTYANIPDKVMDVLGKRFSGEDFFLRYVKELDKDEGLFGGKWNISVILQGGKIPMSREDTYFVGSTKYLPVAHEFLDEIHYFDTQMIPFSNSRTEKLKDRVATEVVRELSVYHQIRKSLRYH